MNKAVLFAILLASLSLGGMFSSTDASPLKAETVVFFDGFDSADAIKQDTVENIHFTTYIYNRSRSPAGAVLMEVVDPLNTSIPFQGIGRSSTDPYDAWDAFLTPGDTGSIDVYNDYTAMNFDHTSAHSGPGHGNGLVFGSGAGAMSLVDAGASMFLVGCTSNGPGFGTGFSYAVVNGATVSVSLTYQCRTGTDRIYIEIWSNQHGPPSGPIFTSAIMNGAPGTWYNEHVWITSSRFYACVNGNCTDTPLTNIVHSGDTYDIQPANFGSFGMTNRAWWTGHFIQTRVRDAWVKWVTDGVIVSQPISPPSGGYLRFEEAHQDRAGGITFDILDSAGNVIYADVSDGQDLRHIIGGPIRLRANFSRSNLDALSPVLDFWRVVGIVPDPPPPTNTATQTPSQTPAPTNTATQTPSQTPT